MKLSHPHMCHDPPSNRSTCHARGKPHISRVSQAELTVVISAPHIQFPVPTDGRRMICYRSTPNRRNFEIGEVLEQKGPVGDLVLFICRAYPNIVQRIFCDACDGASEGTRRTVQGRLRGKGGRV